MARERITLKLKIDKAKLKQVEAQIGLAIRLTGDSAKSMVLERLSKRGLSDEQLASMDHPYARRHGSIKSINSNPTEYVGMRTGSIIRSLKGGMKGAKTYSLGFKNPPTHGQLIFQGTRIMLPRNPLMVVADPQKQSTLLKVFQKVVKL